MCLVLYPYATRSVHNPCMYPPVDTMCPSCYSPSVIPDSPWLGTADDITARGAGHRRLPPADRQLEVVAGSYRGPGGEDRGRPAPILPSHRSEPPQKPCTHHPGQLGANHSHLFMSSSAWQATLCRRQPHHLSHGEKQTWKQQGHLQATLKSIRSPADRRPARRLPARLVNAARPQSRQNETSGPSPAQPLSEI